MPDEAAVLAVLPFLRELAPSTYMEPWHFLQGRLSTTFLTYGKVIWILGSEGSAGGYGFYTSTFAWENCHPVLYCEYLHDV